MRKIIKGHKAELRLADDNETVQVILDSKLIYESKGATWKNLNKAGLEEGYLEMVVESHLEKIEGDKKFEEVTKRLGW